MSEFKRSKLEYSIIDRMDVEVLRRLLEEDYDDPDGIIDEEAWLYACEVLARKEKEQGAKAPDAEAALREFQREYLPYINSDTELFDDENRSAENITALPKKKKTFGRFYFRILAAVVAVLILGTATASAMGFDIWNGIISWTRETFGFSDQISDDISYPVQLDKIKGYLESNGVDPMGLLPSYIPEGYYEVDTQYQDVGDYSIFFSALTNGKENIALQYWQYRVSDIRAAHQKDDGIPEEYKVGERTHYITSNEGKWCCVWIDGNIECSIFSVASRDELIKIINSIYGGK